MNKRTYLHLGYNSLANRTLKHLYETGKTYYVTRTPKDPALVCECNAIDTITETHATWCPDYPNMEIYVEE